MAHMNGGFENHGLDEDAFGPKGGLSNLKTFDAFRKLSLLKSLRKSIATALPPAFAPQAWQ
jgi:hypothetical protein